MKINVRPSKEDANQAELTIQMSIPQAEHFLRCVREGALAQFGITDAKIEAGDTPMQSRSHSDSVGRKQDMSRPSFPTDSDRKR